MKIEQEVTDGELLEAGYSRYSIGEHYELWVGKKNMVVVQISTGKITSIIANEDKYE
jgi:hypothetical protein